MRGQRTRGPQPEPLRGGLQALHRKARPQASRCSPRGPGHTQHKPNANVLPGLRKPDQAPRTPACPSQAHRCVCRSTGRSREPAVSSGSVLDSSLQLAGPALAVCHAKPQAPAPGTVLGAPRPLRQKVHGRALGAGPPPHSPQTPPRAEACLLEVALCTAHCSQRRGYAGQTSSPTRHRPLQSPFFLLVLRGPALQAHSGQATVPPRLGA